MKAVSVVNANLTSHLFENMAKVRVTTTVVVQ